MVVPDSIISALIFGATLTIKKKTKNKRQTERTIKKIYPLYVTTFLNLEKINGQIRKTFVFIKRSVREKA